MKVTSIKKTTLTKFKNGIKGYFTLSDGTKTKFEIDNQGEWYQWGNTRENLCITVPKVERIVMDLIFNY
jgi:hypothetical protein